jgi:chromosome segregation ATPase
MPDVVPTGASDASTPKGPSDASTPKGPSDASTPKGASDASTPKGPSDASTLEAKRAELKSAQVQIATLSNKLTGLQADIKALEAKAADIQKSIAGYDQLSAKLRQDLDDAQKIISQKIKMAEAAVKDQRDAIDKKIADFDKSLTTQTANVQASWDASKAATTAADEAERDSLEKAAAYTKLKNAPKVTEEQIKGIRAIIDQAIKAQDDVASMYFLLNEAKQMASTIIVSSPTDYQNALMRAQDLAEQARAIAMAKRAEADKAGAAYAEARKALEAAQSSRRIDLTKSLKEIKALIPA